MPSGNGLYGKQDLYGRLVLNLLHVGKFFMFFCRLMIFFSKSTFSENFFQQYCCIHVGSVWGGAVVTND